jgi:leader peptidase (prepilin peptidase)/N-methyltransferase
MNDFLITLICAAAFATAASAGVLAGDALCAGRTPHEDGPTPVAYAHWPFPLAGAVLGFTLAQHAGDPARLSVLAFAVLALAGCAAADLACGMLPDLLTLAPLALAIAAGLLAHDPAPLLGAALIAVPFAGAAFLSQGRGMGWGDVKLAALGGALLGAGGAALAFALAGLAAYLVARRSGRARTAIAFGPYLAGSIAATLALIARSA